MTDRETRWQKATDTPLLIAAVVYVVVFALPIILYPNTPPALARACMIIEIACWLMFIIDYLVRLLMAPKKLQFVRKNWFDLLVVALPALRPLRLLRLVTVLSMFNRRAASAARTQVGLYMAGGALILTFVGGLAVLDAERHSPDANILTFGDSIWWAITTMTTVGYGDKYPVTGLGRAVAVGLMISGIAVLGTVTASLSSWIIEKVGDEESGQDLAHELGRLRSEVSRLTSQLEASHHKGEVGDAPPPSSQEGGEPEPPAVR